MKALGKLFLLACIVGLFAGCEKDDTADVQGLAGQWKLTDIHSDDGVATISFQGFTTSYTYSFVGKDYTAVVTFTEDPNTYSTTGSYVAVFTSVISGVESTQEVEAPAYTGSGMWEINGDVLTQTVNGQQGIPSKILELSSTKLRLRLEQNATVEDMGTSTTSTATVFATFERL